MAKIIWRPIFVHAYASEGKQTAIIHLTQITQRPWVSRGATDRPLSKRPVQLMTPSEAVRQIDCRDNICHFHGFVFSCYTDKFQRPPLTIGLMPHKISFLCLIHSFIHSFIPAISIAPLQVLYYSEALQTTARILYRSFTPK